MSEDRFAIVADKHEIETLQRLYAKATDFIGHGTAEKLEQGREIYRSIFTAMLTFVQAIPAMTLLLPGVLTLGPTFVAMH